MKCSHFYIILIEDTALLLVGGVQFMYYVHQRSECTYRHLLFGIYIDRPCKEFFGLTVIGGTLFKFLARRAEGPCLERTTPFS